MASSATSSTSAATPTRPTSFVTQPGHETANDEPAHTDPSLPVAGGAPHRPTPPPPDDRHAAAAHLPPSRTPRQPPRRPQPHPATPCLAERGTATPTGPPLTPDTRRGRLFGISAPASAQRRFNWFADQTSGHPRLGRHEP